jgi:FMN phosphatase YigB (HAD superfamily)
MRAKEFAPRKLVIFDIDDTLVHTQTKVHVVKDNQVIKSLNSHDFTHYKLQPGESFDFGDFRDAREFFEKSKPIIPMINQLKRDIATGNKVVMVTARSDFDDRELFLDTFRKYGVDMSRVHVYRAGNMTQKVQTEEKKKIIIRELLNKALYTKAIMYDDAEPNLHAFISLKDEYPHTKFYAWHVSLDGEASEYHRTDETVTEAKRKKRKPRWAAYGPGPYGMYGTAVGYSGDGGAGDGGGGVGENFADGKNPQDKGDSKRHGINTKASVSSLRKTAKQGGRKGQLAHWLANMKAGRAKKK